MSRHRCRGAISLALLVVALFLGVPAAVAQPDPQLSRQIRVSPELAIAVPEVWTLTELLRDAATAVRRAERKSDDAYLLVVIERRFNHEDALQRLREIAQEQPKRSRTTKIGGWVAIERVSIDPIPTTAEREDKAYEPTHEVLWVTTAIAADDLIIRLETMLETSESNSIVDEVLAIGRSADITEPGFDDLAQREAEELERLLSIAPKRPHETPREEIRFKRDRRNIATGAPVAARTGNGELEITTSADGQTVIVAANPGYAFSTNGGASFTAVAGTPAPFPRDGDPSLATGASGTFYYSFIGYPNGTAAAGGVTGCSSSISTSTTGATFTFRSHAVLCTNSGSPLCFPDQAHIAADRVNPGTGTDQVYVGWRNFTSTTATSCNFGSGSVTPRIRCSTDSGNTWQETRVLTGGDFPRVTVATNGFVYVAYRQGANMMLDKYSACSAGLNRQIGFPRVVSTFTNVVCPVSGLDRCNDGNSLSSPTAAADDLNPNHIYFAFATSTSTTPANENIVVADSVDGGTTFPRSVVVNDATPGRRFMPWLSTYGGAAYVSWFDRSMATTTTNDLTRYFGGSASVRGGVLVRGAQLDISRVTDPQCASGWECGSRAKDDSDSCTAQPQFAGRCRLADGSGSQSPCDYSAPACPGQETCRTSSGCPKYGDYNGNAARNGRFYVGWSSATPPPGVTALGPGINVYADALLTPSDYFVRDWTTNATTHDRGEEPSTNPWFFASSDVWSQTTSTPHAPIDDWVLGDLARRGAGTFGDNFVFARVSRRAAAANNAPIATVNAQFYTADFGLGTPFVPVGTAQPITFNAGDLTKTLASGLPWHVDETASTHVCLAVEIDEPSDPLATPSLTGNSPGPADPLITIDNNKAQRNIDTVPGTEGSSGVSGMAMIQNSASTPREIELTWDIPEDACARIGRIRGALGGKSFDMPCRGSIRTERLLPGEHRWLEVTFDAFGAKEGEVLPIRFAERGPLPAGTSAGFVLGARGESLANVIAENASEHFVTFTRATKLRVKNADIALRAFAEPARVDQKTYIAQLKRSASAMSRVASALGLREKFAAFSKALATNDAELVAPLHTSLLRAIDAQLTEIRLAKLRR